jgi:hypothetical protein
MMGDARETPITELLTACGLDESYANRVVTHNDMHQHRSFSSRTGWPRHVR